MSSVTPSNPGDRETFESPGLVASAENGRAYELKFLLNAAEAQRVEGWALENLTPDPHGHQGRYRVTSVYCDTTNLDVFHRSPGFRRSKFRLRRYDGCEQVFLERKSKRGDRVRKKRVVVGPEELIFLAGAVVPETWPGEWFSRRIQEKQLQPAVCVTYQRRAFFGLAAGSPVRLTLDHDLVGRPALEWNVPALDAGETLLPHGVLLELKFHEHLPVLFQDLLPFLPAQPARVSKYRKCVDLCGLAGVSENSPVPVTLPNVLFGTNGHHRGGDNVASA